MSIVACDCIDECERSGIWKSSPKIGEVYFPNEVETSTYFLPYLPPSVEGHEKVCKRLTQPEIKIKQRNNDYHFIEDDNLI